MNGGDLEPVLYRRRHYRVDFRFKQNEITHHHRSTMSRLERDPSSQRKGRLYDNAVERHIQITSRKAVAMNVTRYRRSPSKGAVDFFPIDFLSIGRGGGEKCSGEVPMTRIGRAPLSGF